MLRINDILRLSDFVPLYGRWWHVKDERVAYVWVELCPASLPSYGNMLRTTDISGLERTLFYFPENTVVVAKETPC